MNENHHGHQPDNRAHHSHRPYWKRAHTDWRLWVGVLLMFAAMIYYVLSIDLASRPGSGLNNRSQTPSEPSEVLPGRPQTLMDRG